MIVTIPIGFGNGFARQLESPHVLIHGCRYPVVGTISMNLITVNVTYPVDKQGKRLENHSKINIECGDEVVVFGAQGHDEITCEDIASNMKEIAAIFAQTVGCMNHNNRIYIDE